MQYLSSRYPPSDKQPNDTAFVDELNLRARRQFVSGSDVGRAGCPDFFCATGSSKDTPHRGQVATPRSANKAVDR
jgi:hypothetical protein